MKTLRNIIGLIVVCATAAMLAGCGEDNNKPAARRFAPASLNGQTYTLTDAGPGGTITFDSAANNYSLTQGGVTENGTFQQTRGGDVWNVTLVNAAGDVTSQLTMTFTGNGVGTYTYDRPGATLANGSFALSGTASTTGTDTGTSTSTGTNTGTSASTGTTTSTGTNTGADTGSSTSTGTTTGTGTVPAPATLSQITVTTVESGIGPNSVYTVTFSGGTSGTFTARNTEGNVVGTGNFNYQPNGTTAHLNMTYNEIPGDFDDMTLIFTTQPGGGASQFTGTQRVGGHDYNFTGTFTY